MAIARSRIGRLALGKFRNFTGALHADKSDGALTAFVEAQLVASPSVMAVEDDNNRDETTLIVGVGVEISSMLAPGIAVQSQIHAVVRDGTVMTFLTNDNVQANLRRGHWTLLERPRYAVATAQARKESPKPVEAAPIVRAPVLAPARSEPPVEGARAPAPERASSSSPERERAEWDLDIPLDIVRLGVDLAEAEVKVAAAELVHDAAADQLDAAIFARNKIHETLKAKVRPAPAPERATRWT